jgi:ferredoxin-type protein NapH
MGVKMKGGAKNRRFGVREIRGPLIIFLIFWIIALVFWKTKGNIFFLFNFGYIGTAVGVGISAYHLLPRERKPAGRKLAQFLIGIYMLGFLGLFHKENMQIEGFFFYLLGGFFAGSVIHYSVAKIFGPIIFGRGWCGWACWTAMILDLLPYTKNKEGRVSAPWEHWRYIHFGLSLSLVMVLWFRYGYRSQVMGIADLYWLAVGNVFYFASGISLALALRDNRAFCKYLCPITALLKLTSRFALIKIEGEKDRCTDCGACTMACPMDINIPEYIKNGERVLSSECIFCQTCTTACPEGVLSHSFKVDLGGKEILRRRGQVGDKRPIR